MIQVRPGPKALRYVRTTPDAHILAPPNQGEVGFSMYSAHSYRLDPVGSGNNVAMVDTGLKIALPRGYFGLIAEPDPPDYLVIQHHGIIVKQSIVDYNFRTRIILTLINLTDTGRYISPGDKVAKLILLTSPVLVTPIFASRTDNYTEVNSLPEFRCIELKDERDVTIYNDSNYDDNAPDGWKEDSEIF